MINLFRLVAFLEGISYILLLFIAVPIKYLLDDPTYVKLLGMPHGGTFVPQEIFGRLNDRGKGLDDTDWHIAELYSDLVPNVTTVEATFHRYVIDANRDPEGQ